MAKREYSAEEKAQFAAQKQSEFDYLVQQSQSPNPIARSAARKELNKIERKNDAWNRKNNPAKYAEKLESKAQYYRDKAATMQKPARKTAGKPKK